MRDCPYCLEAVKEAARRCCHCGSNLVVSPPIDVKKTMNSISNIALFIGLGLGLLCVLAMTC